MSKVGIALDSVLIAQDIAFLKRLPAVSNAYYEVKKESKNTYQLKITIEENFTSIPVLNFWTTTNNQFAYKVGFYDYNFWEGIWLLVAFIKIMLFILMA